MTATEIDPREPRLPAWAQNLINDLRRRVQAAEASAEEARLATNPEETNTVLDAFPEAPIGLPNGGTVRFKLSRQRRDWIDVRAEGGYIYVMGNDLLTIEPRSGNLIQVTVRDR